MTDDSLPELRASDADREQTAEILRQAAGEGRLTMDELEERLNLTYESRTHGELEKLTADVRVVGRPGPAPESGVVVRKGEGGTGWLLSIMSGHDRKGRWRVGRSLKVVNFWGGSDLDLNDAELADDYVEMTVVSIMGGAEIRVPEGLNVELSEFAFMGGNDIKLGDERPVRGGPTLRLKVISIMAGVSVKRGRKRSREELRDERRALKRARHEERSDRTDH